MIYAITILNLITLGLVFWFRKDQKMSNDLHEAELQHTHQGMNAMMDDFNNYQVETDRKITQLEKQLEIKTTNTSRQINKLKKEIWK